MHFLFNLLWIKEGLLQVSSITCSLSGGTAQTALGTLRASYVSLLQQDWRPIVLNKLNEKCITLFHYTDNKKQTNKLTN
jgi:hypothetical protein